MSPITPPLVSRSSGLAPRLSARVLLNGMKPPVPERMTGRYFMILHGRLAGQIRFGMETDE